MLGSAKMHGSCFRSGETGNVRKSEMLYHLVWN